MRLSQTHPPAVQDLASQSESAKELFAQWNQLEVHNGLVYRRWARQDDKNDVLQLLVPVAARKNFLKRTHAGMTGGHLGTFFISFLISFTANDVNCVLCVLILCTFYFHVVTAVCQLLIN